MRWVGVFVLFFALLTGRAVCHHTEEGEELAKVANVLVEGRTARIEDVAWSTDPRPHPVKLTGSASIVTPVLFAAVEGGERGVAFYDARLYHRYEHDDETKTSVEKRWRSEGLRIAESTDAWVEIDVDDDAWVEGGLFETIDVEAKGGVVELGKLRMPMALHGHDRFWFEAKSIQRGAPLFAAGVVSRSGDRAVLRAPAGGRLIVSVDGEAKVAARIEEQRKDHAFLRKFWLAFTAILVVVGGVLGVVGLLRDRDE